MACFPFSVTFCFPRKTCTFLNNNKFCKFTQVELVIMLCVREVHVTHSLVRLRSTSCCPVTHFRPLVHFNSFARRRPKHPGHLPSAVFPALCLGLGFFFWSLSLACTSFPFPLVKWYTLAGWGSGVFPCRKVCCFFTTSDFVIAFSKVSLGSNCNYSENFLSFSLTTILSRMRSPLRVPNWQYSATQYKSVTKLSTDLISF